MVVFSTLRERCVLTTASRLLKSNSQLGTILKRHGGHGHVMEIEPTSWNWRKAKDLFHFYSCIAAIFYGSIILYANIFVGSATLREIPDGYRPKHWEYYRHPIPRFIKRYGFSNPQQEYEMFLHWFYEEDERWKIQILDKKIQDVMKRRKDYQAFYYRPITVLPNAVREDKKLSEHLEFTSQGLTVDGFPTDLGFQDSDLSSEFSQFPPSVEN